MRRMKTKMMTMRTTRRSASITTSLRDSLRISPLLRIDRSLKKLLVVLSQRQFKSSINIRREVTAERREQMMERAPGSSNLAALDKVNQILHHMEDPTKRGGKAIDSISKGQEDLRKAVPITRRRISINLGRSVLLLIPIPISDCTMKRIPNSISIS